MATRSSKKRATTRTADEQADTQNAVPAETVSSLSNTSTVETVPDTSTVDKQNQQIIELQQLTSELVEKIATMQAQNARDIAFLKAVEGVERATDAVLRTPTAATTGIEQRPAYRPIFGEKDCGCSPCDCISERCCSFDIIMTHIRVTHMQFEPVDSNINPLGKLEVRVFAAMNGIGAVYPNLWSHVQLHKTLFDQGVWQGVNVPIGTVEVCKGQPKTIPIELSAVEIDSLEAGVVEALTALRDEYGTNTELMTLDCCCSTNPTKDIEVKFTGGSGLARGAIEGRFEARKKCC